MPSPPAAALAAGRRGTIVAVGLVALAIALPLPTLFRYQGPPMEEGFMLVFPERVLAGDVPNRDFLHLYGPGSLWGLAAWFRVVGVTLETERIYGLVQHLGVIFGVFRLALPWGRRVAVACGLLAVVFVVTPIGLTALAWNGGVALGLVGIALALPGAERVVAGLEAGPARRQPRGQEIPARDGRRWLVLGGVAAGLALLWRPDLAVALGLAGLALLWGRWSRDLVRPLVGGLIAGVTPILVHLAMAGPGNVVEGMFLQPVFDLRGGRHLPIPPSWRAHDGALQKVADLRPADWPLPMLEGPAQVTLWFALLPLAATFVLVTGIVALRREPGRARSRVLLVVGAYGFGLLPQALQRPDTTHLAWVSSIPLAFVPVAVVQCAEWWSARGGDRPVRLAGPARTGLALLPLVVVGLAIPAYTTRTWADLSRQTLTRDSFGWDVRRDERTFYLGAPEIADAAQRVTDDLDTLIEPGDRLFVGTADLRRTPYSDAYFYYLFPEATPATYYIEMDPGIANAPDSGLADEVASADWLVLSHVWDPWDEPNDSRRFGPDGPNEVVREEFCARNPETDTYILYERC